MLTFYIVGVVVMLLASLAQVAYEIAYEKEDRTSIGAIVLLAFFSWLSIFTIVMTVIFSIAKKNRDES